MVKKTHEEFLLQMKKKNKYIEILSDYVKNNIKVKCKCKICGFEYESTPSNLLQGKGCKKCHFRKLSTIKVKSHKQFVNDLFNKNRDVKILSRYTGRQYYVECECLIHNEVFSINAGHLLSGETGCKQCIKVKSHLSGLKPHVQFVNEMSTINEGIKVLGKYDGAKSNVDVECLKCGHIWSPTADSLLRGYGCPRCKRSKGEEKIEKYLINNNFEYIAQKKFSNLKNIKSLSYDFYLPKYNLLIEYQGQFHDGTTSMVAKDKYFNKQQQNDKIKKEYANHNGYNLLEIWYYDFDNIETIIDKCIYNLKNPVTTKVI